jgi:Sec-independent protein translocase protein TatA
MLLRLLRFVPLPELIIVALIAIVIFGPRDLLRLSRWRRG